MGKFEQDWVPQEPPPDFADRVVRVVLGGKRSDGTIVGRLVEVLGLEVHGRPPSAAVAYDVKALAIVLAGGALFDFFVWQHTLIDMLAQQTNGMSVLTAFCIFVALIFTVITVIINRSLFLVPADGRLMRLAWRGGLVAGVTALTMIVTALRIFAPEVQGRAREEAILAEMARAQWGNEGVASDHEREIASGDNAKKDIELRTAQVKKLSDSAADLRAKIEEGRTNLAAADSSVATAKAAVADLRNSAMHEKDESVRRRLEDRLWRAEVRARDVQSTFVQIQNRLQHDEDDLRLEKDRQAKLSDINETAQTNFSGHVQKANELDLSLKNERTAMRSRYDAVLVGHCTDVDQPICNMKLTLFEQSRVLVDLVIGAEPRWPPFISVKQRIATLRSHGLESEPDELARHRAENASVFRGFSALAMLIALFIPVMLVCFKMFMRAETRRYLAGLSDDYEARVVAVRRDRHDPRREVVDPLEDMP